MPIHVLLADDHKLVRAGIRVLLEEMKDVEVVAEAGNGREAVAMAKKCHPDIVLMDIAMAELNGLEAVPILLKNDPDIRVLILSMHATEEYVLWAMRAGARGYLLKNAAEGELDLAVHAVARGETYLSPPVSKYVVDEYMRRLTGKTSETDDRAASGGIPLTARQKEVLQLIAEGHSTKEIAQRLDLSVKTVDVHRTQLMERLDIHDIAGLVRYAIRIGLVSAEE